MLFDNIYKQLDIIKDGIQKRDFIIEQLKEENKRIKEEAYKDNEIKRLNDTITEMHKEFNRGFYISEKEQEAIDEWKKKHDKEAHGITTLEGRMRAAGTIGDRYTYEFTPTSIGTIGSICCSCGEEFVFQELL